VAQTAFVYAGETVTVDLTPQPDGRLRARVGGREYAVSVTPLPDGGLLLDIDGARHTVYTAVSGADRLIAHDGAVYTVSPPGGRTAKARGAGSAGGDLTAAMPGVVRAVLVSEGDAVTRGAGIVVLEAMKMEMRITAPHDGTVTRLAVNAGDVVTRGQLLAVIA
jgi:biotin carboxyl carrier protein